jgi:hypothetical protein
MGSLPDLPPKDAVPSEHTESLQPATKECPYCAEVILKNARKCKHCGEFLDPSLSEAVPKSYSDSLYEILAIAKAQKGILWCILAAILPFIFITLAVVSIGQVSPETADLVMSGLIITLSLIIMSFEIYFVYKLAVALKSVPILWVLGMFIPCIGFILLSILSSMATKSIQMAGFKVGLMGANISEIEARLSQR